MTAEANISDAAGGRRIGRRLVVLSLFALTLALLILGGLIVIPNDSGFENADDGLRLAAFLAALVMFVVALPERETRVVLGVLLGALGATLLLLLLADVSYRFIAQSDEGEFSMMLIALLAGAAILWLTGAIGPVRVRLNAVPGRAQGAVAASPRYAGLPEYATRVLWSTPQRRAIVTALGLFYGVAAIVSIASSGFDSGGLGTDDIRDLAINGGIAAVFGFLASRTSNRTLKSGLWVVAGVFVLGLVLGTGFGVLFFAIALHASIAFAALAASAAAGDAGSREAKIGFTLLAVVAAVAWVVLALYGLFIFALFASGYES